MRLVPFGWKIVTPSLFVEYLPPTIDSKLSKSFGYCSKRELNLELLSGKVYYNSKNTLRIETTLLYDVGQFVSIGGYPYGGRKFRLLELSITDNPVLDKAKIISRKVKNDN